MASRNTSAPISWSLASYQQYTLIDCTTLLFNCTVLRKTVAGENFGEFGETNVIHQYFTHPNYRSNELAISKKIKFTNIFFAKTLKQSIRQSFPQPLFCAIRYTICNCHLHKQAIVSFKEG